MSRFRLLRLIPIALVALTSVSVSGCASVFRGSMRTISVAPSGLPWGEELVRRSLAMGTYEQAMAQLAKGKGGAPDDDLLRALFRGQVAYYAGRWQESANAFAEADRLTDARYTKSVSRGVLSVLTNDHALKYVPPRTEQLFSRYYAMLGRVQSGDVDGAAVEARRLSALLESSAHDVQPAERATHAALRDVAGAVFESAAEWNDASVAYRNAALLRGATRSEVDSIVISRPAGDSATLLLVVESGFAAHYVERTLALPLDDDRPRQVNAADHTPPLAYPVVNVPIAQFPGAKGRTTRPPTSLPSEASPDRRPTAEPESREHSAARFLAALNALPDGGVFAEESPAQSKIIGPELAFGEMSAADASRSGSAGAAALVPASVADDWTPRRPRGTRYLGSRDMHRRWLEIAWPSLLRPRLPSAPLTLTVNEVRLPVSTVGETSADISDAIGADARRLRAARLARLTMRTVTRAVAVDAVREKHGEAAGLLASILASALESADTRAWHLLPGKLTVYRVTVPAGELSPSLLVGAAPNSVPLALTPFVARAGAVHLISTRVWRDPAGSTPAALVAQDASDDARAP